MLISFFVRFFVLGQVSISGRPDLRYIHRIGREKKRQSTPKLAYLSKEKEEEELTFEVVFLVNVLLEEMFKFCDCCVVFVVLLG